MTQTIRWITGQISGCREVAAYDLGKLKEQETSVLTLRDRDSQRRFACGNRHRWAPGESGNSPVTRSRPRHLSNGTTRVPDGHFRASTCPEFTRPALSHIIYARPRGTVSGMARASTTFRVFVSSTFSDLKAERNALQKFVFPRLRELCQRHGGRFQAIDLRWGIRDEATLDQQTMRICLEEIARCRQITRRPNFIVLLGDRYGWRPLPFAVPADEFGEIERRVGSSEDRTLLARWYKCDENAVPPVYDLQPRDGDFEDAEQWSDVEWRLRRILLAATEGMADDKRLRYCASATEQEIVPGALGVPDAHEHVFGFFRTIKNLPRDKSARDFVDLDEFGHFDAEAHGRLEQLKKNLRCKLGDNIPKDYEAEWRGTEPSTKHIGSLPETLDDCMKLDSSRDGPPTLCLDVWRRLSKVILAQVGQIQAVNPVDKEKSDHEVFGEERAPQGGFVGREDILEKIADYVSSQDRHPRVVWGESGCGKTALLAKASQDCTSMRPDSVVVVRFIGATPSSSDGRALLEGLCKEITREYGGDETGIPADYRELVREFPARLALATAESPLVLFLDAVDQLSDADNAGNLAWLPQKLPEHVRLVVSTLPAEWFTALKHRLPKGNLIELGPMSPEEGQQLLDLWLANAGRRLQRNQRDEVLGRFELVGLPLYVKLAFEEARRWKSYTPPADAALSPDVPGIIQALFERLSRDPNHGRLLVSRSLSYLCASRRGLSEDEMIDVLSRDNEVLDDFKNRAQHTPPGERLPFIVWSRLSSDLEPYLAERDVHGATLSTFYHGQLGKVAAEKFLAAEEMRSAHAHLSEYFGEQDYWIESLANVRKVSELPYQYLHARLSPQLKALLTDLAFVEAKTSAGMIYDLIRDYGKALPNTEQATTLRRTAIGTEPDLMVWCPTCDSWTSIERGFLGRVMHCASCAQSLALNPFVLRTAPPSQRANPIRKQPAVGAIADSRQEAKGSEALPEQLAAEVRPWATFASDHARVLARWGAQPRLLRQLAYNESSASRIRDETSDSSPKATRAEWLRRLNRPALVPSSTCPRVLGMHRGAVEFCGFSPDCRWLISGGSQLCKWDLRTGELVAQIEESTWGITLSDHAHLGSFAGEGRKNLRVFAIDDLQVREIPEFAERIVGCSADAQLVLCSGPHRRLFVRGWGASAATIELEPKATHGPLVASFSPDGRRVAISFVVQLGNDDFQAIVRDGDSLSPDAMRPFMQKYMFVGVWELASGKCVANLPGYTNHVSSLVWSPDGALLATVTLSGSASVWDVDPLRLILEHEPGGRGCAFSPDGNSFVLGGRHGAIEFWTREGESWRKLATRMHPGRQVLACAFSPDGQQVATGGLDRTVKTWAVNDLLSARCRKTEHGAVFDCVFSSDGSVAASGFADGTVGVWDARSGALLHDLHAHDDAVETICAVEEPPGLISACPSDGRYRVWQLQGQPTGSALKPAVYGVGIAALAPDQLRLLTCGERKTAFKKKMHGKEMSLGYTFAPDRRVLTWDLNSRQPTSELKTSDFVSGADYSPDGRFVLVAVGGQTVLTVDTQLQSVRTLSSSAKTGAEHSLPGAATLALQSSPRSRLWSPKFWLKLIAGIMGRKRGKIIVVATYAEARAITGGPFIIREHVFRAPEDRKSETELHRRDIAWLGGAEWNAVLLGRRQLCFNNPSTGKSTLRKFSADIDHCAASPDGRRLLLSTSGTVSVLDLSNGQVALALEHDASIASGRLRCAFTPDGGYVVSYRVIAEPWSPGEHSVQVWDARTGALAAVFPLDASPWCISMCADGRLLVGDATGSVYLLRLEAPLLPAPATAVRLFRKSGEAAGQYDSSFSVRCPWCAARFEVPAKVLAAIREYDAGHVGGDEMPPWLHTKAEAWTDDRLLIGCARCTQPVQLNPFVVDTSAV